TWNASPTRPAIPSGRPCGRTAPTRVTAGSTRAARRASASCWTRAWWSATASGEDGAECTWRLHLNPARLSPQGPVDPIGFGGVQGQRIQDQGGGYSIAGVRSQVAAHRIPALRVVLGDVAVIQDLQPQGQALGASGAPGVVQVPDDAPFVGLCLTTRIVWLVQ